MWTLSKQIPAEHDVRPARDRRPADQARQRQVGRRRSTTSTSPTSCRRCSGPTRCSSPRRRSSRGSMTGERGGRPRRRGDAEVEEAEPRHGRELHDLGEGPRLKTARGAGRSVRAASRRCCGRVPGCRTSTSRRLVALLALVFAYPVVTRRRLLDAPHPRRERALRRARQLPLVLRGPDLPRGASSTARLLLLAVPVLLAHLDLRRGAALRASCAAGGSIAASCSCPTSSPCRSSASSPATSSS